MTYIPRHRRPSDRLITAATAQRERLVPPALLEWTPRELGQEIARFYRAKGLEPEKITLASGGLVTAYTATTWAEFSVAWAYPESA